MSFALDERTTMANASQLTVLLRGVTAWNTWRLTNPSESIDLSGADLSGRDLSEANLTEANLANCNLSRTRFDAADISKANLSNASLNSAYFNQAKLEGAIMKNASCIETKFLKANLCDVNAEQAVFTKADFRYAEAIAINISGGNLESADLRFSDFTSANLSKVIAKGLLASDACFEAANFERGVFDGSTFSKSAMHKAVLYAASLFSVDFTGADLNGAKLIAAHLGESRFVRTDLSDADLSGAQVYGTSVWDVDLGGSYQDRLEIMPDSGPYITSDNLKVAQFLYLILANEELNETLDALSSKVVLILGRFTPERKAILDAIRTKLRQLNLISVIFDFERPGTRSFRETVSVLAHFSRLIIADVTDAKVVLQELEIIVPRISSVPVIPILENGQDLNVVISKDFGNFRSFLPLVGYDDEADIIGKLQSDVLTPAEAFLTAFTK